MAWYTQLGTIIGPLVVIVSAATKWITRQMHKHDDERDGKIREVVYEVLATHMREEENTVGRIEKRQMKLQKRMKKSAEQHAVIISRIDALDKRLSA